MAQNFYRLVTLLADIGAKVLRRYLQHHSKYTTLPQLLNGEKHQLYHKWYPRENGKCCCRGTITSTRSNITRDQFDLLFNKDRVTPPCSNGNTHHCWFKAKSAIDFDILDITLANNLIVNVKTIKTLSARDSAALKQIRDLRNSLAHIPGTSINDQEFELKWCAARDELIHIAKTVPPPFTMDVTKEIDELKTRSLDESECNRLLGVVKLFTENTRLLEEISADISDVQSTVVTNLEKSETIQSDVHDVKSYVQTVRGEVKDVKSDVRSVQSEITDVKSSVQGVQSEIRNVKSGVQIVKSEVKDIKSDVQGVQSEVKGFKSDVWGARCEIRDVKSGVQGVKSEVKDVKSDVQGVQSEVKGVKSAFQGVQSEVNEVKCAVQGVQSEIKDVKSAVQVVQSEIKSDVQSVGNKVQNVKSDIRDVKTEVLYVRSELQTGLKRMERSAREDQISTDISNVQRTVDTNLEMAQTIQSDVRDIKSDVQTVRGEVKDVKSDVRGVQSELTDVRNEVKSGVQGVQSEIKDVRNELKSDVRDVQTDVLNVKSEVKGVRSVVQELQTGLKRMEQITREPKLEPLIENTQTILKTHHKNLYVSGNRAEKAAYKGLCKDHFITIIGQGGQGKTTLGKHLMHKVCNEHLGDQDTLTPVILDKADDFNLIQSKDRLVLFIDDPFGKSNINKTLLEEWERQFDKIVSFVSEGNIYIIMAIRSSILNECSDKLKYDLFKEKQRVDLTSDSYRMTQEEKYVMLESYCDKHNVSICRQEQNVLSNPASQSPVGSVVKASSSTSMNTQIDYSMLHKISKSDPYLGFPQSCYSFFTNKKFFDKGLDFFKHPSENVQRDIYSMKKSDPLQYIVLVYMMLEGGEIDLNELNEVKLEKLCENTQMQSVNVENIKECVRFGVNGVYIQKLEESTESQDLIFRFTHQCILESVLLSFCNSYPGVFLELGQDGQIDEFARPAKYKRMSGEVCVILPRRCHKQLAERFLHRNSGKSILWLVLFLVRSRFYTDISFVKDVFDAIDASYSCITGGKDTFYSRLLYRSITEARKDDKNLLIFFKTLCKHFAIYRQTTSENFVTGQQSLEKVKLPVSTFIDVLNYIIECGDIKGVEELLDISELDLHARYEREYDSCHYLRGNTCAVDEQSSDLESLDLNRILFLGFENPVCFSCIRGYKNLTVKLLDSMNIVNLNEIIERLMYILVERDWSDVLQRLMDKHENMLQYIRMSKLILHAAKCKSKGCVLYFLELNVDLTLTDTLSHTVLHYCCENDWVDIFDNIVKKNKDIIVKVGLSPSTLILHAASHHSKQMVSHLLQYDVDFTVRDEDGNTLLHNCCKEGWVDIFDWIVKKDKHVLEKDGLSPSDFILYAARHYSKHMVSHLLQYDVDFTVRDEDGKTLLHYCCKKGWVDIFGWTVKKDKHVLDKDNLSPSQLILHTAWYGSKEMVSHLLQYDVDFTMRDENGNTLLHYCCKRDWVDISDRIVRKDKHLLDKDGLSSSELILHAASHDSKQMVSHLLQYDVDFTVRDDNGNTLLYHCCKKGWVDIFDWIVKKDKHVLDKDNLSPSQLILHAARHYSKQMVSHLLQYDVDFTVRDEDGNTLLNYCCKRRWDDIFDWIVKKDKHVLDKDGLSPSELILHAARLYSKQMVSHLLQYDVDFTMRDKNGYTLLHYCCKRDWVDISDRIVRKDKHLLDKDGLSSSELILHAASHDSKQMVSHLLQYDVDFTVRGDNGNTLLYHCCKKGWVDIFDWIVKKDKHVLDKDNLSPSQLILHAARHYSKQMVSHLLQYDVDFTVRDEDGNTLLHYCCKEGWVDIFDRILKKYKHVLEKDGLSPSELILHAASHDSENMVSHLLQYDVDFTLSDEMGNSLLHYICFFGWEELVCSIVNSNQGIINLKNSYGRPPIFCATQNKRKKTVILLLKYGADVLLHDNAGNTLLHYCVKYGWLDIIQQHLTDTNVVNCRNNVGISPLHTAFLYFQSNVVEELCKSGEKPQEEINTCSKIICLRMLINVFCSKNRRVLLPNNPDFLDNMIKHKFDLDSPKHPKMANYQLFRYQGKAKIDYFYNQFLKHNEEYSVGFFEPLRPDDHGYTVIHLLVMGASSTRGYNFMKVLDFFNNNYGYNVCDLLGFFIYKYKQSIHVRNTTLLPTALHIAAYLGREEAFIRLYKAGIRGGDGDLSIVETVKRGKLLCSHVGCEENIWSHSTDLCLLMKSSFFDNVFFSVEENFNSILDFCERNSFGF